MDEHLSLPPEMRAFLERAARTRDPCLILGETGSGKTHLARMIHAAGPRSGNAMVHVNCAEIPRQLAEGQLFGHVRGAFTGAVSDTRGLIEQAHGATLFLDEIGELPTELQPKHLRFCDTGRTRRVGATRGRFVDVRLIAATNRDPRAMVVAGQFREDLYYRVAVLVFEVKPIRRRRQEIPRLVERFLSGRPEFRNPADAITPEAVGLLQAYPWPGNIRELENVLARLALAADGSPIGVGLVEEALRHTVGPYPAGAQAASSRYVAPGSAEAERAMILEALEAEGWHRDRTARRLGMGRTTLYQRMLLYGLHRPPQPMRALPEGGAA